MTLEHTVKRVRSEFIWFLNKAMILARVCLRFGMATPRVLRDAIAIILWKDGCSKALIGYIWYSASDRQNQKKKTVAYLVSFY